MTEISQNQSRWNQDSILIKLGVITALILLLLIPSAWIESLITDREGYQQQMTAATSDKWSGSQLVQGPVLMLPYRKAVTESNSQGKLGNTRYHKNIIPASSKPANKSQRKKPEIRPRCLRRNSLQFKNYG